MVGMDELDWLFSVCVDLPWWSAFLLGLSVSAVVEGGEDEGDRSLCSRWPASTGGLLSEECAERESDLSL